MFAAYVQASDIPYPMSVDIFPDRENIIEKLSVASYIFPNGKFRQ